MAHFAKYHISDVKKLLEHDNRTNTDERENVDKSRSHLNYNLHDIKEEYKFFRDKLEFVKNNGGTVRADSVVMISEIVTLPEDFSDDVKEQKKFFKGVYELAIKIHGKENIISAWVHCDEAKKEDSDTLNKPHIHIKTLPILKQIKKYKNGTEKERLALNANKILTPEFLGNFHNELDEFLENYLGYKTSVHTGITKAQGGHKEVDELKATSRQLKKNRNIIDKDSDLILAEQKQILDKQWKEYQNITRTTWNQLTPIRNRIKNSIWELKKGDFTAEKQIRKDLDFWGNLANGLLFALCSLLNGLFLLSRKKTIERQLNDLKALYEDIEGVRRTFSNQQHNVKENLMNKDLEKIENTLSRFENTSTTIHELIKEVLWRMPEIESKEKADIEKEYER